MPRDKARLARFKTVNIGGYVYTLIPMENLISRYNVWGRCNHVDKEIHYDSTIPYRDFLATLLHEFYEALKNNREMGDLEHRTLTNIEDGTHQFLIHNADTVIDILKQIKKD